MAVRCGEFEKVSLRQFREAMASVWPMMSEVAVLASYRAIELPSRATKGSAGYDIKAPFSFALEPDKQVIIPTGIRVKMQSDWYFSIFPRSGMGFKHGVQLANTVGIIDADYYDSDNEGHIFLKLTRQSGNEDTVFVNAGDGIVQGIFVPFGITYSDNADGKRNGGFGSTGR